LVLVKKKICFWFLQNFLFFKIVLDPFLWWLVYVAHDDWTHFVVFGPCKIFCFLNRSLQKILFLKIVPGGTILKNKKFCRDQKQIIFFYRDQNLNGSYLQGRVQYLRLFFNSNCLTLWLYFNINDVEISCLVMDHLSDVM